MLTKDGLLPADQNARDRARNWVADELVRQELSATELARRANVDTDTVADFLSGKRWPQPAKRSAISRALGYTPESIDLAARNEQPARADETVAVQSQDAGVLLNLPDEALDGLGPAEREEVQTAARLSALQTAREIRRRLDQ